MTARTTVYTDGACSGNPGPGGWAWAVPHGDFASGAEPKTTNQRMELTAVLGALRSLEGPLHVVSDSTYVVNCFRDRWWEGWIARGWKNSQKKPVANRDLWEPLVELVRARDVTFEWVKGHSGDPWNDVVDRLAVEAAASQSGRRGDETPDISELSQDAPKPRSSARDLDSHGLVVFGHRPPELGGYEDNPIQQALRTRLRDLFRAKAELHGDLMVVTGMALGTEMIAAEAAALAEVPYTVVLAYPDLESPWPELTRRRFRHLVDGAADVITLQKNPPKTRQQFAPAFARRDAWLRKNATEAVIVWDGSDAALGKTYRNLVDALGEEDVWVIDPAELNV
jgi:ribonuclease HI/uncharacterized phage-like protein YoqJ